MTAYHCLLFKVNLALNYLSVLETVGLQDPARHIRNVSMLNGCSSSKISPSAGCASAADVVCTDDDVFETKTVSLNHISQFVLFN
jgi:hypothetical protein